MRWVEEPSDNDLIRGETDQSVGGMSGKNSRIHCVCLLSVGWEWWVVCSNCEQLMAESL